MVEFINELCRKIPIYTEVPHQTVMETDTRLQFNPGKLDPLL
jgi:hypothetical protein